MGRAPGRGLAGTQCGGHRAARPDPALRLRHPVRACSDRPSSAAGSAATTFDALDVRIRHRCLPRVARQAGRPPRRGSVDDLRRMHATSLLRAVRRRSWFDANQHMRALAALVPGAWYGLRLRRHGPASAGDRSAALGDSDVRPAWCGYSRQPERARRRTASTKRWGAPGRATSSWACATQHWRNTSSRISGDQPTARPARSS